MATITKNQAGSWKAVIRKTGWPTAVKTFRTKRDAEDWARRVEDEMVRGVYIDRAPAERLTLKVALARYIAEVTASKSLTTQAAEKRRAATLIAKLGNFSLAAITPQVVSEYRDQRLTTRSRFGRNMSVSHVRLEIALLSHLFTVAIQEWGLGLAQNPVSLVRKPKPAKGRNRRITLEEQDRLLAESQMYSNPMLHWIVILAIETGMRKGELITLTRRQIDLQRRVIYLPETKNGSARSVPLTRTAARILQEATNHAIRPTDTDLVFWGEARDSETRQRKPYDFREAWELVRDRAGIPDVHFHDLRHEAISRLVEAGLGDQEVAAISGHKSMQMLKRYTHLRTEDLVAKLDRVFQQKETKPLHSVQR